MSKYIQATAKKQFCCAWKCSSCESLNVDFPQAEAFARENITLFQKEDKARAIATEKANQNLNELLERIPTFVNQKLNYNQLTKCGTCKQCSAVQPWAKRPPYTVILAGIVIATCIVLAVMFSDAIGIVVMGGIAALLAAIAVGEILSTGARRRAAQQLTDEYCRPLAITNRVPDYVQHDDPRLNAILNVLAKRQQS